MSRLNASTPRPTSSERVSVEDDAFIEFARKGLRVVLVGGILDVVVEDPSWSDLNRSGTRAAT